VKPRLRDVTYRVIIPNGSHPLLLTREVLHKQIGSEEAPYTFTTVDQLVDDFWNDAARF
jgi:hypothetical protein